MIIVIKAARINRLYNNSFQEKGGLLFVGKSGIGGKNYKVAVVPKDIREELEEMLK